MPGFAVIRAIGAYGLIILSSSACGGAVSVDPAGEACVWPVHGEAPRTRYFDTSSLNRGGSVVSHQTKGILQPPWVGRAGPSEGSVFEAESLWFGLTRDRRILLPPWVLDLGSGDSASLIDLLGGAVEKATWRRTSAEFECDRWSKWADVRELIRAVRVRAPLIGRLTFVVAPSQNRPWPPGSIVADRLGPSIDRSAEAPCVLYVVDAFDASAATPTLQFGGVTFAFSPGDPYAPGRANVLGNENWRAVRSALREAATRRAVTVNLAIADDVPWAYVVTLIAVVIDAGISRIELDGLPYRVSTPPPLTAIYQSEESNPGRWSPVLSISLGAALGLLTLAIGAIAGRRRGAHGRIRRPHRVRAVDRPRTRE